MGLSLRQKLIIVMVVLGGGIAALTIALMAVDIGVKTSAENETKASANAQVEVFNQELMADLEAQVTAGDLTQDEADQAFEDSKASIQPLDFQTKYGWIVVTAFIGIVLYLMLAVSAVMLWFRRLDLPMTWAETLVHSAILFGYFSIVFGFIPHFIIDVWDNVWPKQQGFFVFPFTGDIARWFEPNAIGWEWAWYVPRDIIVAGWYVVTFVGMVAIWWWVQVLQEREPKAKEGEPTMSAYGRPVMSGK